jgi:hypothetical protein
MKERLKEILPTIVSFSIFIGLCFLLFKCKNSETKSYDTRVDDYPIKEEGGCKYSDGSYSATVDYYNPDTGHSASYDLEVEVEDCEVTTIYFPKGGWLDDSHISPTELDSDGNASIEDDEGKTFDVHIED